MTQPRNGQQFVSSFSKYTDYMLLTIRANQSFVKSNFRPK